MQKQPQNLNHQSAGFSVKEDGLYAITITASCHKNQDLRVEIDDRGFREIPPVKNIQKFNIPASYNGTKLKGKTQTNIFILNLTKGQHTLNFISQNGAQITNWTQQKITDPANAVFDLNLQAQNLNRQPFVNFILVDLPLSSITAEVITNWRHKLFGRGDGDDVKLIIDNQVFSDNQTDWLWRGAKHQNLPTKSVATNLPEGVHYIEFIADRSPKLSQVQLNLSPSDEQISFVGDYKCMVGIRKINGVDEEVIGIYVPGRDEKTFVPSNESYRLYFNGQQQPLGPDLKGAKGVIKVQFDLLNQRDFEDKWYFFGVDTTHIFLHLTSWSKHSLWTIYDK